MSKNIEEERPTIVKLNSTQFKDLLIAIDYCITRELKNIINKLEKLENAKSIITRIERELKLIRIEIKNFKK